MYVFLCQRVSCVFKYTCVHVCVQVSVYAHVCVCLHVCLCVICMCFLWGCMCVSLCKSLPESFRIRVLMCACVFLLFLHVRLSTSPCLYLCACVCLRLPIHVITCACVCVCVCVCVCAHPTLAPSPHQRVVPGDHPQPVHSAVLLGRGGTAAAAAAAAGAAALVLVDGVPLGLCQAEEAADHAQVLPQRAVLRVGFLLPAQQLTQPPLWDRGQPRRITISLATTNEQRPPCRHAREVPGAVRERAHTHTHARGAIVDPRLAVATVSDAQFARTA